ncbi:glycosyltransferase, partial [candidate division KSB1 bacterium]|nr:glycosyltransferase [candidate division KSB1 bacterium]
MKHILIIDHTAALGGAEYSLESLVKSMDSNRYQYTVALPGPGPFADRLKNIGIQVNFVRLESWRWWVRTQKQLFKFFITLPYQVISLFRWILYLKNTKPDIVHLNINRLIEPVIASRILRIPNVMHFRDIPSRIDSHFILGMPVFYKIMKLADVWIANSEATYNDIKKKFNKNLFLVPNGIDLDLFDRLAGINSNVNKCENSKIKIAMVALLVPWKNHMGLLKLASIVTK